MLRFVMSLLLVGLLMPSAAMAKKFTINTAPIAGGRVSVNGSFVGVAPVVVKLKLKGSQQAVVEVEKAGAISFQAVRIDRKHKGVVLVRLEADDSFEATMSSDVANTWLTVPPARTMNDDGTIDEDLVWQKLVGVVSDNFSDLEQMDRGSFYIRTAWRIREFDFVTMRNRLVVKANPGSPMAIKVRLEAQMAIKPPGTSKQKTVRFTDEDFKPTDRVFQQDKETMDFLRDQL